MKILLKYLIIFFLIFLIPIQANSAEILQIKSSNNILVGDQNRNILIELFCSDVDENNEQIAINLLKKEFPRGNKVKIKPIGFRENILIAKVFNINETKEMSTVLIKKGLTSDKCQN